MFLSLGYLFTAVGSSWWLKRLVPWTRESTCRPWADTLTRVFTGQSRHDGTSHLQQWLELLTELWRHAFQWSQLHTQPFCSSAFDCPCSRAVFTHTLPVYTGRSHNLNWTELTGSSFSYRYGGSGVTGISGFVCVRALKEKWLELSTSNSVHIVDDSRSACTDAVIKMSKVKKGHVVMKCAKVSTFTLKINFWKPYANNIGDNSFDVCKHWPTDHTWNFCQ